MTCLYKGVAVMHMLLCTQVVYSILPMSVMHLVSKYGHYEGAVTSGLCGKLMANREGKKKMGQLPLSPPRQRGCEKGPLCNALVQRPSEMLIG